MARLGHGDFARINGDGFVQSDVIIVYANPSRSSNRRPERVTLEKVHDLLSVHEDQKADTNSREVLRRRSPILKTR